METLPDGSNTRSRHVVDIRELNSLLLRDAYPIALQQDVIEMLIGCKYISVLDTISVFY